MTGKRTRYSAEFKARVALEALRGELTTAQLAAKHGIHQTMAGSGRCGTEGSGHMLPSWPAKKPFIRGIRDCTIPSMSDN